MSVEIITLPSQQIISITKIIRRPGFALWESDFLLRGLRIKNTSDSSIKIEACILTVSSGKRSVRSITMPEETLKTRTEELGKILPHWNSAELGNNPQSTSYETESMIKAHLRFMAAGSFMGTRQFWEEKSFVNDSFLKVGQETGFLLEHFRILDTNVIDELIIAIKFKQENQERMATVSIPIVQYKSDQLYDFPLRGSWYVMGGWTDPNNHRMMSSQEFAYDFLKLDTGLREPLKKNRPNNEFPCYGEAVLAIGDGEVVNCFDGIPENECSHVIPDKERLFELVRKYGHLAALFGNYVILKHTEREFSFYGHLIPNSLKVSVGHRIMRGELIGKVGNSGNSEGPHLHFQLMDSSNFLEARGLPCYFTNTMDSLGEKLELIDKNNSIIYIEDNKSEEKD